MQMLQIMASVQRWTRVMALLKEQLLLHLEHRQIYSKTDNEALACIGWQKSGVPTPGAATLLFALTTVPYPHCFLQGSWMCRHDTCSTCLCFNYSMKYKPGQEKMTVDCLSRLHLPAADYSQEQEPELVAVLSPEFAAVTVEELKFDACPILQQVKSCIVKGWPHSAKKLSYHSLSPSLEWAVCKGWFT